MDKDTLLQHVRSIAEDYVKSNLPDEYPYFPLVWDDIKHPLLTGHTASPKKKSTWFARFLPTGPGFDGGNPLSVLTPAIILTLEATTLEMEREIALPDIAQFVTAIDLCAQGFGLPKKKAKQLAEKLALPLQQSMERLLKHHETPNLSQMHDATLRPVVRWSSDDKVGQNTYITRAEADALMAAKDKYSIFVADRTVYVRTKRKISQIVLGERPYVLLVMFLRYKGWNLPTESLFLKACGFSHRPENLSDKEIVEQYLKLPVHRLKNQLQPVGFEIPQKQKLVGYTCTGEFTYCVILHKDREKQFELSFSRTSQ